VFDRAKLSDEASQVIVIHGAREHNLKNISLALPRGQFIVVTGVSGSGKSTLMKVLFGMLPPDAGTIIFRGRELSRHHAREAMAAGIPVIASRIGGVPYTVSDGVTGLLCEPGDPVDLAAKIARLLDDPDLRREMGLAGRRRFEADFTWETVIERYWRPLLTRRTAASST